MHHTTQYTVENKSFTCQSPAPSAPAASPSASQRGVGGEAGCDVGDDRFFFGSLTDSVLCCELALPVEMEKRTNGSPAWSDCGWPVRQT